MSDASTREMQTDDNTKGTPLRRASSRRMSTHVAQTRASKRERLPFAQARRLRECLPAQKPRRWSVAARVWWSALLLAPCLFGGMMLFLDSYGQRDHALAARQAKASAIVVLGAAVNAGGAPGTSLRARTLHGVALYHKGVAPFLVFTGGVGNFAPAESRAAALLAQRHGVPPGAILLEDASTSTWENIGQATRICRARGWSRVVVVSHPYHLWRAQRNFKSLGIQAWTSPAPNPVPYTRFRMAAREVLSVTRDFLARR